MSIIKDAISLIAQVPEGNLGAVVMLGAFGLAAYAIYVISSISGGGK